MSNLIKKECISPLSTQEQIDELNGQVKCTIKPSSIEGVGVFAVRDLKKGEKLYCRQDFRKDWYKISYGNFGKLFSHVREIIMQRWPSVINGGLFQSPNDVNLVLFMNHSSESNYEIKSDTAIRDIACGEEVLEDYRVKAMKIVLDYPPNYEAISKTFNLEGKKPVFTFGNLIYNPHNGIIDRFLMAHEEVHAKQQGENPKEWWDKYLVDPSFRVSQEAEAYQMQYREARKLIKDKNQLAKFLHIIASDFSSSMYGSVLSYQEAYKIIRG